MYATKLQVFFKFVIIWSLQLHLLVFLSNTANFILFNATMLHLL